MTQLQAVTLIEQAPNAKALFVGEPLPKTVYNHLARLCHPDIATEVSRRRAEDAFKKLSRLWAQLNGKTVKNLPVIAGYAIERELAKGDICDLYLCSSKDHSSAVLKIAQSPRDNDLVVAEASALKTLHVSSANESYKTYIPKLLQDFKASGRQANILSNSSGYWALNDILSAYPKGLDFKHSCWMMNRLLSALAFAHNVGIVHGAILPEHLMYHPVSHGLLLIDWCYSVKTGDKIRARAKASAANYPPEVSRRMPATPSLDIYMAAMALRQTAEQIPRRFGAFFDHCLAASPSSRPQDALAAQDRWVALAAEEFGPPTYLALKVPVQ